VGSILSPPPPTAASRDGLKPPQNKSQREQNGCFEFPEIDIDIFRKRQSFRIFSGNPAPAPGSTARPRSKPAAPFQKMPRQQKTPPGQSPPGVRKQKKAPVTNAFASATDASQIANISFRVCLKKDDGWTARRGDRAYPQRYVREPERSRTPFSRPSRRSAIFRQALRRSCGDGRGSPCPARGPAEQRSPARESL